jgi:NAD(P)H-hydrate epimerase
VDALIGYGLRDVPQGRTAELVELCNHHALHVLSLDVPSGLDATTGEPRGAAALAERTLTLALPKTGLRRVSGELYLANIVIPPEAYLPLGQSFDVPLPKGGWVRLDNEASL